jgi:hypothetical protein
MPSLDDPSGTGPPGGFRGEGPTPIEIVVGATLCRLRVWTEAQWAALPTEERPRQFVHAPGLGWVGGVTTVVLN